VGTEIISETFGEQDYARFRERLERCLSDLGELLARPGFGVGPVTIGAELEACLVDDAGLPLPRNQAVRDLVTRSEDALLEVRNFGETTLTEVRNKLRDLGLHLGMRLPQVPAGV
jgi:hypothetical protein